MATRQSITEKVTHISAGETRHLKEKHKYVLIVLLLILHEIQKSINFLCFYSIEPHSTSLEFIILRAIILSQMSKLKLKYRK